MDRLAARGRAGASVGGLACVSFIVDGADGEEFARVVAGITVGEPQIGLVSNVTGQLAGTVVMGVARYWVDHVRRPVRFADGVGCWDRWGLLGLSRWVRLVG